MFDALSGKLSGVFDRLRHRGALSEADVAEALREVRLALLDADVALPVVKDFIAKVRERAVGAEVLDSVAPGQQVVKIVNDALVEALGGAGAVPLNLNAAGADPDPDGRAAGLGQDHHLGQARAAADAARAQAGAAGQPRHAAPGRAAAACSSWPSRPACASLPIVAGQTPVRDRRAAPWRPGGARSSTSSSSTPPAACRSTQALMDEVRAIRDATNPAETLLVVDAMTGQDAVNTAKAFNEALGVTGIVHDPHGRRCPRRRGAVDARRSPARRSS